MTNAILSQFNLGEGRTLVLRRYAGKRKTRVLIQSAPTHEVDGIQFVSILYCKDFGNLKDATEKFNTLAFMHSMT